MIPRPIIMWIAAGALVGLLVGCQTAASTPPPANPETFVPLFWQRDPTAIVFRADRVSGDPDSLEYASGIPDCTIYGDNRVVWVNLLGPFETQVLYDRVGDERIYDFIERMTVTGRLFTFQIPTSDPAEPAPTLDPAEERETLMLAVSGSTHLTDARSGWGENYYEQALDVCKTLSGTPVLFEPIEGAWLTAVPDPGAAPGTSVTWDAAALELSLASAVNGPIWIDPVPAVLLWRYQRTLPDSVTFNEDGVFYRIYLQVPGITRRAPPPPAS